MTLDMYGAIGRFCNSFDCMNKFKRVNQVNILHFGTKILGIFLAESQFIFIGPAYYFEFFV